ncbi:SPOR domain-containing protein [Legionella israelensis]|uniref:SPOR domain-containing protein n=1 Tax=Legionella israelensis TaxID=454 RepID=UPI0011808996|nr:SPOR domain-containing protein [Legionella israelensis]QDP72786.1 SPOR domain-containing protein [Legionella israelensis]
MKIEMDEKIKHRLIGLAVIISIAAIFAPAIIKKSSQRPDRNVTMNVKLPPKPLYPNVVIKSEKELFQKTKVAHVELAPVPEESQLPQLTKADVIEKNVSIERASTPVELAKKTSAIQNASIPVSKKVVESPDLKNKALAQKNNVSSPKKREAKGEYTVQLASFSKLSNAEHLLKHLESKGYLAKILRVKRKTGGFYFKVHVVGAGDKHEAEKLKQKLASTFQLNGFVIHTGVS